MAVTDPIVPGAATVATVIDRWIRTVTDAALSKHRSLALLKEGGRIKYNCSGYNFKWPVQYHRPDSEVYSRLRPISSPQENLWTSAELPLRARVFSRSIDEFTKLASRGNEALVDHWKVLIKEGPKAIMRNLGQDLLQVDGNASGYTDYPHGLPSCLGTTGSAVNSKWAYAPSDTYAGLSTVIGNYGGTATDFPLNGTEKAVFWSPILCDYSDASLSATTDNWKNNWRECLDLTSTYLQERQTVSPDIWLMTPSMFLECKRSLEDKETIYIERGNASTAAKLGWDHITYSGVDLVSDQDMPSETCYGLVLDSLSLQCMYGQLVKQHKQDDITTLSTATTFAFFGNFRIETPAHVIKIADLSA